MVACWQLFLEFICGVMFTVPIQVGITSILGGAGHAVFNFMSSLCNSLIGAFGGGG